MCILLEERYGKTLVNAKLAGVFILFTLQITFNL